MNRFDTAFLTPENNNTSYKDNDNNNNPIQEMFGGTLRSVLFCETCGSKRAQSELFLIISLPFRKKELTTNTHSSEQQQHNNDSSASLTTRKAKSKVDILQCLDQFTAAESLADPVQCLNCSSFTPTLQQHTFAKFP